MQKPQRQAEIGELDPEGKVRLAIRIGRGFFQDDEQHKPRNAPAEKVHPGHAVVAPWLAPCLIAGHFAYGGIEQKIPSDQ